MIIEKNGRLYGYAVRTKPTRQERIDEYFDLAWLSAKTEVNLKNKTEKRERQRTKSKHMPFFGGLCVFALFVVATMLCREYGLLIASIPFTIAFILMNFIGWNKSQYDEEELK